MPLRMANIRIATESVIIGHRLWELSCVLLLGVFTFLLFVRLVGQGWTEIAEVLEDVEPGRGAQAQQRGGGQDAPKMRPLRGPIFVKWVGVRLRQELEDKFVVEERVQI